MRKLVDAETDIQENHPRPRWGKTAKWRQRGGRPHVNTKDAETRGHLKGHLRPAWVKRMSRLARGRS